MPDNHKVRGHLDEATPQKARPPRRGSPEIHSDWPEGPDVREQERFQFAPLFPGRVLIGRCPDDVTSQSSFGRDNNLN